MKRILTYILTAILLFSSYSCVNKDRIQIPKGVKSVIDKSGRNRIEIMLTISHYMKEDSLKLNACYFFIENLYEKYYPTYLIYDANDSIIDFNLKDYANADEVKTFLDSIMNTHQDLHFGNHYIGYDYYKIKNKFIIRNIDTVFNNQKKFSWSKHLEYDDLLQYVLPHRNTNECFYDFRDTLTSIYLPRIEKNKLSQLEEIVYFLRKDLFNNFKRSEKHLFNPTDMGVNEVLKDSCGRAEDLANYTCAVFRSLNIGTGIDFIPAYSDTNTNDAWNFYINENQEKIPFYSSEHPDSVFHLNHKFPKVYRITYKKPEINLEDYAIVTDNIPPLFRHHLFQDVTKEYTKTIDLTYKILNKKEPKVPLVYLCIWNGREWKAIDWALSDNHVAKFENIVPNLNYTVASYFQDTLTILDDAFVPDNFAKYKYTNFKPKTKAKDIRETKEQITFYPKGKNTIF